MKSWKFYTTILTGFVLLSSGLFAPSASAKPKGGRGHQTIYVVPSSGSSINSVRYNQVQLITLSGSQRNTLYHLLRGHNTVLLPRTTLVQIVNQRNSLPRGLQRQLARGKGLPRGIAKKIPLSRQVVSYLNLPRHYDLYMIGSNAVLIHTVTGLVADFIPDIL